MAMTPTVDPYLLRLHPVEFPALRCTRAAQKKNGAAGSMRLQCKDEHRCLQCHVEYVPHAYTEGAEEGTVGRRVRETTTGVGEESNTKALLLQHQEQQNDVIDAVQQRYPRGIGNKSTLKDRVERAYAVVIESQFGMVNVVEEFESRLELLDSISHMLGWKVLCRYPEEFAHKDAYDLWCIMTALLFTTGFSPQAISVLLSKHPSLFAYAVRAPDLLKSLSEWLKNEIELGDADALRIINRFPLILQTSVEVLEPRVQYLVSALDCSRKEVVRSIVRHPELLSVSSNWIQERIDFYRSLGVERIEMRRLFKDQPSAFAVDVSRYLPSMVCLLREKLGCDDELIALLLVRSGILSRSVSTIDARSEAWMQLGLSPRDLRAALKRFPRLLLYPISEPKYRRKLDFLAHTMKLPLDSLVSFPQYMSYSLEGRIIPRVMAVKELTGKFPSLSSLAMTEAAYIKAYSLDENEYQTFVATHSGLTEKVLP